MKIFEILEISDDILLLLKNTTMESIVHVKTLKSDPGYPKDILGKWKKAHIKYLLHFLIMEYTEVKEILNQDEWDIITYYIDTYIIELRKFYLLNLSEIDRENLAKLGIKNSSDLNLVRDFINSLTVFEKAVT